MITPLLLLTLLPAWLVGMVLIKLLHTRLEELEQRQAPATLPVRQDR